MTQSLRLDSDVDVLQEHLEMGRKMSMVIDYSFNNTIISNQGSNDKKSKKNKIENSGSLMNKILPGRSN